MCLAFWVRGQRRKLVLKDVYDYENVGGIGYPNEFKHLNSIDVESCVREKTIDFEPGKKTLNLSTKLNNASEYGTMTLKRSFNFMKDCTKKAMTYGKKLVPEPIFVKDYMRAVGSNWPSEDDQVYIPPKGSLIADGNEVYYRVAGDGFAYPIDTMGRIIKSHQINADEDFNDEANTQLLETKSFSHPVIVRLSKDDDSDLKEFNQRFLPERNPNGNESNVGYYPVSVSLTHERLLNEERKGYY